MVSGKVLPYRNHSDLQKCLRCSIGLLSPMAKSISNILHFAIGIWLVAMPTVASADASKTAAQKGSAQQAGASGNHVRSSARASARIVRPVRLSATMKSVQLNKKLTLTKRVKRNGTVMIDLQ